MVAQDHLEAGTAAATRPVSWEHAAARQSCPQPRRAPCGVQRSGRRPPLAIAADGAGVSRDGPHVTACALRLGHAEGMAGERGPGLGWWPGY
jgi:hypothetical protein